MKKPPALAVVGDTHANSVFGLMPPEFRLDAGNVVRQNKYQAWLWKCWLAFWEYTKQFQIEGIVLNGDLPQGINAGRDAELLTVNDSDQINLALEVLAPLEYWTEREVPLFLTRGTGFHAGNAGWREEQIGKQIGAVREHKSYSQYEWNIHWRNKLIYATHHTSNASVYPHTPLHRQQNENKVAAHDGGDPVPDVDVRSHVHRCSAVEDNQNRWIVTAPAWQLWTQFGHKVAPKKLPHIGGLVIWLDEEGSVYVKRKLFPLPPRAPYRLTAPQKSNLRLKS